MFQSGKKIDHLHMSIRRLVKINANEPQSNYAKKGILFAPVTELMPCNLIDLYNQGCPVETWAIPPEKVRRNELKIFSTGDAFSIVSPEVNIRAANINIHVGLEHASHSPLVLLHEALQLCRVSYEHGAQDVIVSLPEQFHPALYPNDFNLLLMRLFKASGANSLYFYDKNYTGVLDENAGRAVISLILSEQSDKDHYQIDRNDLMDYLHLSNNDQLSIDAQVIHFTRKSSLKQAWSKFDLNQTHFIENLCNENAPSDIKIPAVLTREHVLVCCSANKPLAEKIAVSLCLQGETVKICSIEGKGEQATIPTTISVCGALVTIVQSTRPNPEDIEGIGEYQKNGASSYFFEALMIARQAHLRGAHKINLINPYQFSARSDRAENSPNGKTGAYVQHNGQLLAAAGVNQVFTAECHDAHTLSGSYTGKKIKGSAVSALSIMATRIARRWVDNSTQSMPGQFRLVTPDEGATKRTKELTLQLQTILGEELCGSPVLGKKQRDSHRDDSAVINSLNSGKTGIKACDKYVIADDETATGSTLCQAITNLRKNGANDIAVIVVHNNMPLDWLLRQLCLARFLYLGVSDLHLSDTQEMGVLARSYEDLVHHYSLKTSLPVLDIEHQVLAWFEKNISEDASAITTQAFSRFKSMFNQFETRITIHSFANEFANQVKTTLRTENNAEDNCTEVTSLMPASNQSIYTCNTGELFFPTGHQTLPITTTSAENRTSIVQGCG